MSPIDLCEIERRVRTREPILVALDEFEKRVRKCETTARARTPDRWDTVVVL